MEYGGRGREPVNIMKGKLKNVWNEKMIGNWTMWNLHLKEEWGRGDCVTQRDLKVRRGGGGGPHGHGKGTDDGRSLAALSSCGGGDCRSRLATRPSRPDPDNDQVAGLGGGDQPEDDGADGGGQVRLLQIKNRFDFTKMYFSSLFV